MAEELHRIANRPPQERADAARNRQRVLTAAAGLFAEHGVDGVTMDAVAQAAGVGKGTVFRRFGDKSGLVVALLDERERELQEAVLSGPPPLGPEAPDKERMLAFLGAYVDYLAEHLELIRLSETAAPGARYRIGAYHFWHRHLGDPLHRGSRSRPPRARAAGRGRRGPQRRAARGGLQLGTTARRRLRAGRARPGVS